VVEIVGYTGYDFAWIDAGHGCLSLSEVRDLIRAADASGIDSIVRVPNHSLSSVIATHSSDHFRLGWLAFARQLRPKQAALPLK
jgi:hypothetical protein